MDLYKNIINLIKDNKLQDQVIFGKRYYTYEEFPLIYSGSDIVILPSHAEGFGLAVIEAMAMKKPIIASNIPGINEIIENNVNGILIKSGEPKVLAKQILNLSRLEFTKQLTINAYNKVKTKYTLEAHLDQLYKIYSK